MCISLYKTIPRQYQGTPVVDEGGKKIQYIRRRSFVWLVLWFVPSSLRNKVIGYPLSHDQILVGGLARCSFIWKLEWLSNGWLEVVWYDNGNGCHVFVCVIMTSRASRKCLCPWWKMRVGWGWGRGGAHMLCEAVNGSNKADGDNRVVEGVGR